MSEPAEIQIKNEPEEEKIQQFDDLFYSLEPRNAECPTKKSRIVNGVLHCEFNDGSFQCVYCDEALPSQVAFFDHLKEIHKKIVRLVGGVEPTATATDPSIVVGQKRAELQYKYSGAKKLFTCFYCSYASNIQFNVQRHIKTIHSALHSEDAEEDTYIATVETQKLLECKWSTCGNCRIEFSSAVQELPMWKIIHLHKTIRTCLQCREFDSSKPTATCELSLHMDTEHRLRHPRSTTLNGFLNALMKNHEPKKEFICEFCTRSFNNKFNFHRHLLSQHGVNIQSSHVRSRSKSPNEENHEQPLLEEPPKRPRHASTRHRFQNQNLLCKHCSRSFLTRFHLERHIRIIHGQRYEGSRMARTRDSLPCHFRRQYSCPLCPKIFVVKISLQMHLRVVHESDQDYEADFICVFCAAKFTNKRTVMKHIRENHMTEARSKPSRFACSFCPTTFTMSRNLKRHLQNFHTSETIVDEPADTFHIAAELLKVDVDEPEVMLQEESQPEMFRIPTPNLNQQPVGDTKENIQMISVEKTPSTTTIATNSGSFMCKCGMQFPFFLDLRTHVEMLHLEEYQRQTPWIKQEIH